jgi:hypothetical protein
MFINITGCSDTPNISEKDKTIQKHIDMNKQEAQQAQNEYNKIKNERTN